MKQKSLKGVGHKENKTEYEKGEEEEEEEDEKEEKNNKNNINLFIKNEQLSSFTPSSTEELWENEEEEEEEDEEKNNLQRQPNIYNNNNNTLEGQQNDQTEIYRELILRHLIADISGTCVKLGLPTELSLWSSDDSRRWVAEMCIQFQIQIPPPESFACLDGQRMLSLSVEEFMQRFPDGGDTLHAQLQLWKTAFESCVQQQQIQQNQFEEYEQINNQQNRSDWTNANTFNTPSVAILTGYNNINVGSSTSPSSSSSTSSTQQFTPSTVFLSSTRRQQPTTNRIYQQQHYQAIQPYQTIQQQYYSSQRVPTSYTHHHQQYNNNSTNILPEQQPNNIQQQRNTFLISSGFQHHSNNNCINSSPSEECSASESVMSTSPTSNTTLRQDDSCSVGDEDQQQINQINTITTQTNYFNEKAVNNASAMFIQQNEPCNPTINKHNNNYHYNKYNNNNNLQQKNTRHHQRIIAAQNNNNSSNGTIHLWHFIRELLDRPKEFDGCVRWVNREEGTFKIESSHHLARYWGIRKNRAAMNYDKLSRSLRQYYKKGIIQKPEKKQRLVYKFLPPYNQ